MVSFKLVGGLETDYADGASGATCVLLLCFRTLYRVCICVCRGKKKNNFVSVFCLRHYISGSTFFAHLLGERVYNI